MAAVALEVFVGVDGRVDGALLLVLGTAVLRAAVLHPAAALSSDGDMVTVATKHWYLYYSGKKLPNNSDVSLLLRYCTCTRRDL